MAEERATADRRPAKHRRRYTPGEEVAHAVSHGFGLALAICALVLLAVRAALHGTAVDVVAGVIFGVSLILMYLASTVYHSVPNRRAKPVLRALDHVAIYLLIAGTYTPFTLITLRGAWGWSLFGVIWGLAAAGVVFKVFFTGRFERLSLAIYLAMGWVAVVAFGQLQRVLESGGLWLLVGGGLCYTGGVVFYVWKRLRYSHAVWHGFVLAGSVLHFFAVWLYVLPSS
jgi:hemolysin III